MDVEAQKIVEGHLFLSLCFGFNKTKFGALGLSLGFQKIGSLGWKHPKENALLGKKILKKKKKKKKKRKIGK